MTAHDDFIIRNTIELAKAVLSNPSTKICVGEEDGVLVAKFLHEVYKGLKEINKE